jgi:hypothetical protein
MFNRRFVYILLKTLCLLIIISIIPCTNASCANSCWGHGICNSDDVCECFGGWTNNDCGDRVCPSGISFVTTPQTDGNFDGDLYDNSMRQFVDQEFQRTKSEAHFGPSASIPSLGDVMTVDANDISKLATIFGEESMLNVNDNVVFFKHDKAYTFVIAEILVKDQQYRVTPPMNVDGITSLPFYPYYPNQRFPHGDWEMWPGQYSQRNEAHFYMECSNNGYCDRFKGLCKCFPGYIGFACEKQRCEKYCHEHGHCKSVSEMANDTPKLLDISGVSTTKGSKIVMFDDSLSIPSTISATGGDLIIIGNIPTLFKVAFHDGDRTLTLLETFPKSYPRSTPMWQKMEYKLWDGHLNRACACDPGYEGWDCSERKCPRGHDPAITYYGGYDPFTHLGTTRHSPYKIRNERQILYIKSSKGYASGNFTLRYYDDVRGETYNTTNIPTSVQLKLTKGFINGAFIHFEYNIMNDNLIIGDYIEIEHEYRKIVGFKESGTRSDQFHTAILSSPITSLNTFNLSTNGATVDISTNAYLITIASPYINYDLVKQGDFIIFNSHVRRVSEVTLTSNGKITAISIAYHKNTTQAYPELLGNVNYWSPFPESASSQMLHGYSKSTSYTITKYTLTQEIKNAMLNLPMRPLRHVKVTTKQSGTMLSKCVVESSAPNRNTLTFTDCTYLSSNISASDLDEHTTLLVGDLIRVGDEVRRVITVAAGSLVINSPMSVPNVPFTSTPPLQIYHLTGWRYEIDFSRGKNDFDEQGTSGDIRAILCEDRDLTSSIFLSQTGHVAISSPTKLKLSNALPSGETLSVGNFVRVGNQTREIMTVISTTEFEFRNPFLINEFSTSSYIHNIGTYVRRIYNEDDYVECHTTDFPQVQFTGTSSTQTVTVDSTNGENNIVTHSELVDKSDILLDDRVAIMDTVNNNWEIRTVYKIISSTSFQVSKPFSTLHSGPLYNIYKATTQSTVCSNRGNCNKETGLCDCFHGYGGHNCHRFEIDVLSKIEPKLLAEYHKFRKFEDENYNQNVDHEDPTIYTEVKMENTDSSEKVAEVVEKVALKNSDEILRNEEERAERLEEINEEVKTTINDAEAVPDDLTNV